MAKVKRKEARIEGYFEENGKATIAADEALVRAVLEAWQIKLDIEAREADLKVWLDEIKTLMVEPGTVVVPGVCRAIYARPQRVSIAHPETLEAILGGRYLDLVRVEQSVKPTEALIELAGDGDDPLAPAVRAALKVSVGESVKLLAEKPAKEARP